MRKLLVACVGAAIAGPASSATLPSSASPHALDALVQCRGIATPTERLACYDAAAATLATAISRKSVRVLDEEDVRQTRRSLFGFSLPRIPLFAGDREDHPIDEIDSTVAQVRQVDVDKFEIRLADGSLWRTTEASLYGDPRAGGKIHIRRGVLGNYFLSFDGARAVRGFRVG